MRTNTRFISLVGSGLATAVVISYYYWKTRSKNPDSSNVGNYVNSPMIATLSYPVVYTLNSSGQHGFSCYSISSELIYNS